MPVIVGGFSGVVVDMSSGNRFGLFGTAVIMVGMTVIEGGFTLVIMAVVRFVWSTFGNTSDDMAVAVFNGGIVTEVVVMITSLFRLFAMTFTMLSTHFSLPPANLV